MAQIDFDDATIELISGAKPLRADFMGLRSVNPNSSPYPAIFVTNNNVILARPTVSILTSSASKFSISYTGTFTSGTAVPFFNIGVYDLGNILQKYWRVTVPNISFFSTGDTFSFIVDVDITGS